MGGRAGLEVVAVCACHEERKHHGNTGKDDVKPQAQGHRAARPRQLSHARLRPSILLDYESRFH